MAELGDAANGRESLLYFAGKNDDQTREFMSALRLYGYQITAFDQLDALLAALADAEPDALLVDRDADDGRLAQAVLQRMGAGDPPGCPVVVVSSSDDFMQRLEAARAGVHGYFIKPVDMLALANRLDHHINRNRVRAYRILTVDDDTMLSKFHEAILNLAGMHVKVLNDPTKVLEELHKFQPELILMDMYMPECTGAEAAKVIRQNAQYLDIPIIFLSSEDDVERQIKAIESGGADNFLTKPIDPESLISIVSSRAQRYRDLRKFGQA